MPRIPNLWTRVKFLEIKVKDSVWKMGLSLISAAIIVFGILIIIFLIWNLGVQHEIVVQAKERLLATDPTDPAYSFYQHYASFRPTTIFGTIGYGISAVFTLILGLFLLNKAR